jgi:hypothetical protein
LEDGRRKKEEGRGKKQYLVALLVLLALLLAG